jgi:hypothetical protein
LVAATQAGSGESKSLLEEPEGVLRVEPAQVQMPEPIQVVLGAEGVARPQPQGLGLPVTGQVLDCEMDEGGGHDREWAGVVRPCRAALQFRV